MATTMKIGTITQAYAAAEFSFPDNPQSVNLPFDNNSTTMDRPYGKFHIFQTAGGVGIRNMVLTGSMRGSSRLSNFNNLAAQIHDANVKRFWISDTKYINVLGKSVSETLQGGRTNFIDYVASLQAVLPYFCSTEKTYVWSSNTANKTTLNDATSGSTGAFMNAGNACAFVQWTVLNGSGGAAITQIEIGDTSDYDTAPHKITWSGSLAATQTLTINVFTLYTAGTEENVKTMEYIWPTVAGVKTGNISVSRGLNMPWVNAVTTDQAFSIKLTGNNAAGTTVTATFNDSYIG